MSRPVDPENDVRLTTFIPRTLWRELNKQAHLCGEPLADFIRHRLAESLPVSTAASRSGCAGDGEAPASPELGAQ